MSIDSQPEKAQPKTSVTLTILSKMVSLSASGIQKTEITAKKSKKEKKKKW